MNIQTHNCYNPNFQAIPVAKTINRIGKLETRIDLWELSTKDKAFLKQLEAKVNMHKLMPNIDEASCKRWHEMLEIASEDTISSRTRSYLAVSDNKPCGIISILSGKRKFKVATVCTWPIETGRKVKMAGQTLFYQMFKAFNKSKANEVTLQAIQDGPFDVVSKYQQLGFSIKCKSRLVDMAADKRSAKNVMSKLSEVIEYEPLEGLKGQNLLEVLNI